MVMTTGTQPKQSNMAEPKYPSQVKRPSLKKSEANHDFDLRKLHGNELAISPKAQSKGLYIQSCNAKVLLSYYILELNLEAL